MSPLPTNVPHLSTPPAAGGQQTQHARQPGMSGQPTGNYAGVTVTPQSTPSFCSPGQQQSQSQCQGDKSPFANVKGQPDVTNHMTTTARSSQSQTPAEATQNNTASTPTSGEADNEKGLFNKVFGQMSWEGLLTNRRHAHEQTDSKAPENADTKKKADDGKAPENTPDQSSAPPQPEPSAPQSGSVQPLAGDQQMSSPMPTANRSPDHEIPTPPAEPERSTPAPMPQDYNTQPPGAENKSVDSEPLLMESDKPKRDTKTLIQDAIQLIEGCGQTREALNAVLSDKSYEGFVNNDEHEHYDDPDYNEMQSNATNDEYADNNLFCAGFENNDEHGVDDELERLGSQNLNDGEYN